MSEAAQPQSNLCCSWPHIHFKDTRDPWVVLYDWAKPLNLSLSVLLNAYGSTPTDSNWNAQFDVYPWPKGDDQIELMDFFAISQHFEKTCPLGPNA